MKSSTTKTLIVCMLFMLPLTGCIMFHVEDVIIPIGATVPASSEGDAELSADQVRLVANLERRCWLSTVGKVSGKEVEFRREGKPIGSAITDAKGRAVFTCERGSTPWSYSAHVQASGERISDGTVYVWPPDRPVLLFDIDDTILKSKYTGMVWRLKDSSPPMPHSRETLEELSKDYAIVYLSVRARVFRDMTRTWLAEHNFPAAPTLYAVDFSYYLKQKEGRVELIQMLQRNGLNIVAGIGDKEADELALDDCGIPVIIVRPGYKPKRPNTILLNGLADLPATLQRLKPPQKRQK